MMAMTVLLCTPKILELEHVMERVLTGGYDLTRARVGWEVGTGYLTKDTFLWCKIGYYCFCVVVHAYRACTDLLCPQRWHKAVRGARRNLCNV